MFHASVTCSSKQPAKLDSPPQAIEKDIWVSTILQLVYTLPFADKLIFKGGTSLSKVWGIINRFSEDIDLAVERSLFGLDGDLTKKQLKKLRKASSVLVREDFKNALQQAIEDNGLSLLLHIGSRTRRRRRQHISRAS